VEKKSGYRRQNMKTISMMAIATALSFSALAFSVTPGAAKGGPIVPPGRYCLSYNEGGTDCSFTSYAQCEATASGIDAECYGPSFSDEKSFRNWVGRTGGFYQGPTY
jgi:hypothetical protein